MKIKYTLSLLCISTLILFSCSSRSKALHEITNMQMGLDSVLSDGGKLMPQEQAQAKELIGAYRAFATSYTNDSLAPQFLFESARLNMVIPDYPAALDALNTIAEKYPDNALAPTAITTAAAICENVLKDCDKATEYLTRLKEKYPDHPTAVNIDLQIEYVCDPEGYLDAVTGNLNAGDSIFDHAESDSL